MYIPPFSITAEVLRLVSDISECIGMLNLCLGDAVPSPLLRKTNRIKTIHSSLAIEHNSLSLAQVTDIIDGKHVLGSPDEIQEVKNAILAYRLMHELDAFDEQDLLKAHGLMMKGLINHSGQYRKDGVGVFDGNRCIHMAPPAIRVPQLMSDLFAWIQSTDVHPLVSSCVFHYEFEYIHPFSDGNGRMGRYWQTMLLARWKGIFAWLPVETIIKTHQQEYYDAIARSDAKGDSTDFIVFMLRCIYESVQMELSDKVTDKVPNKVSDKVANKYLSQTEEKIVKYIKNSPSITVESLAKELSLSASGIKKAMSSLRAKGMIERVGANKNGFWRVKESPINPTT